MTTKQVFISHASEDRNTAEQVCTAIESRGISCFIAPRDIMEGEAWPEGIMRGIQGCQVLVLVFSSNTNRSGMVMRELEKAASLTKAVLPVRLEDVQPNVKMSFFIGLEQWVDAVQPPLEPHLERLVNAVRRMLSTSDSTTLTEPNTQVHAFEYSRAQSVRTRFRWFHWAALSALLILGIVVIWTVVRPTAPLQGATVALDIDLVVEKRAMAQRAHEKLSKLAPTDQNRDILDRADLAWRMGEEFNQRLSVGKAVAQYSAVVAASEELTRITTPLSPAQTGAVPAPPPTVAASLPRGPRLGDKILNSLGTQLVFIPPGRFTIGSPASEVGRNPSDDERQGDVEISRGFWMSSQLTSLAEFESFIKDDNYKTDAERQGFSFGWRDGEKENPRLEGANWHNPQIAQDSTHPVVCVSWNDAVAFCNWLGKKEQAKYRLPTEAEWEYACRAGSTTPFNTGSSISTDDANFNGSMPYNGGPAGSLRGTTSSVNAFPPNSWGLHDMHGNVWQWCSDWYSPQYSSDLMRDPKGPLSGDFRVRRGGSFISPAGYLRSAFRSKSRPDRSYTFGGFRVVMELK